MGESKNSGKRTIFIECEQVSQYFWSRVYVFEVMFELIVSFLILKKFSDLKRNLRMFFNRCLLIYLDNFFWFVLIKVLFKALKACSLERKRVLEIHVRRA